jgi:hypothetical protein
MNLPFGCEEDLAIVVSKQKYLFRAESNKRIANIFKVKNRAGIFISKILISYILLAYIEISGHKDVYNRIHECVKL